MHKTLSFSLLLMLAGCVTEYHHPQPKDIQQELHQAELNDKTKATVTVPGSVQSALLPTDSSDTWSAPVVNERRFRVSAKDVPAADFFASLMQDDRYSIAVHPGVTGTITLDLKQVTLSEVLHTVAEMYGYDIRRVGNIYHIYPAELKTETFNVDYLMMTRQGASKTAINTGAITQSNNKESSIGSSSSSSSSNSSSTSGSTTSSTNGTQIDTTTNSDWWGELRKALIGLIGNGDGRVVVVNPQAGLVTVKAMPRELEAVRTFLNVSEKHLKRQVILETKILEVTLSEGYEQGIDWSNVNLWSGNSSMTAATQVASSTTTNSTALALGGGATFTLSNGTFDAVINLLKTQGDVNTLSSPRVTVTNNQKAVIKVGSEEYFVTGVSSTTQSSGSTTTTTPDIDLTPFFSGIALDVTPQIDDQNNVLLHVNPSVIDITEQDKTINLSGFSSDSSSSSTGSSITLPMAYSDIREADTVVQAKSNDIVVIGGLMRTNKKLQETKVPLLGDIPGLGWAFTNKKNVTEKTELVILLKPVVVNGNTWQDELHRSQQLLDKWYPAEQE